MRSRRAVHGGRHLVVAELLPSPCQMVWTPELNRCRHCQMLAPLSGQFLAFFVRPKYLDRWCSCKSSNSMSFAGRTLDGDCWLWPHWSLSKIQPKEPKQNTKNIEIRRSRVEMSIRKKKWSFTLTEDVSVSTTWRFQHTAGTFRWAHANVERSGSHFR